MSPPVVERVSYQQSQIRPWSRGNQRIGHCSGMNHVHLTEEIRETDICWELTRHAHVGWNCHCVRLAWLLRVPAGVATNRCAGLADWHVKHHAPIWKGMSIGVVASAQGAHTCPAARL